MNRWRMAQFLTLLFLTQSKSDRGGVGPLQLGGSSYYRIQSQHIVNSSGPLPEATCVHQDRRCVFMLQGAACPAHHRLPMNQRRTERYGLWSKRWWIGAVLPLAVQT